MEPKDAVDACMKQAEYFSGRFDQRRTYEWKTTVALWTLLAAGINFVKAPVPLWIPSLLAAAYAFMWLRGIWLANDNDKQMAMHYRNEADRLLREASVEFNIPAPRILGEVPRWFGRLKQWCLRKRYFRFWFGFLLDWSMLFQLTSVLVLVVLFYKIKR